jgi:hypothetical protein
MHFLEWLSGEEEILDRFLQNEVTLTLTSGKFVIRSSYIIYSKFLNLRSRDPYSWKMYSSSYIPFFITLDGCLILRTAVTE